MNKYLLIFFFVIGCSVNQIEMKNNLSNINFSTDLSFEEFKIKLKEFANNSPYPNINN
jgi:hypothetical protein